MASSSSPLQVAPDSLTHGSVLAWCGRVGPGRDGGVFGWGWVGRMGLAGVGGGGYDLSRETWRRRRRSWLEVEGSSRHSVSAGESPAGGGGEMGVGGGAASVSSSMPLPCPTPLSPTPTLPPTSLASSLSLTYTLCMCVYIYIYSYIGSIDALALFLSFRLEEHIGKYNTKIQ